LAPHVWYANEHDGISITDFVQAAPFPETEALVRFPGTLRGLHTLPPFPKAFNYVTVHNGFVWRLRSSNLLPGNEIAKVFTRYEQVCAVYPRLDSDMVSCHMDLKPKNILFDGQLGWQAAFVNDRYFDMAMVANFVVTKDAEECTFLKEYFGQEPDERQSARFFLMRQVLHTLSAAVFRLLGSADKAASHREKLPSFRDFHQRIWAGAVNLVDNDMKTVYGMVHWEQLLHNMRQPRFDEALKVVSDRYAGQEGMRRLLPDAQ